MSNEIRIDSRDLRAFALAMKRAPKMVLEEVATFLTRAKHGVKAVWVKKGLARPFPRYTGEFAGSIHEQTSVVHLTGQQLQFRGDVLASAAHAGAVEEGRPAGTTPLAGALQRWVDLRSKRGEIELDVERLSPARKRVPGEPGSRLKKRTVGERRKVAIRNAAFLIGRKIEKKGSKGYHLAEQTVEETAPLIQQELRNMADRVIQRFGERTA